jgi:hypothetical protein
MGWELDQDAKQQAFKKSSMIYPGGVFNPHFQSYTGGIATDFNARFRMCCNNYGIDISPADAVDGFFWDSIPAHTKPKYWFFCFDNGNLTLEMRQEFYENDRYAPSVKPPKQGQRLCPEDGIVYDIEKYPITDDMVDSITDGNVPAPWMCCFNSKKGKRRIWQVAIELLKKTIEKKGFDGTTYVVDYQGEDGMNEQWVYPETDVEIPVSHYGEADLKIIHYTNWAWWKTQEPCCIFTNDWDAMLNMMANCQGHVDVTSGLAYTSGEEDDMAGFPYAKDRVSFSERSASRDFLGDFQPAFNVIHFEKVRELMPSYNKRIGMMMACMCLGRVDYCKSLARFGFTRKPMLDLMEKYRSGMADPWLFSRYSKRDPLRRHMAFDSDAFVRFLSLAGTKIKDENIEEFNVEIHNVIFCIKYMCGFDKYRVPGGPKPPKYTNLFPFATSVSDALSCKITKTEDGEVHPRFGVFVFSENDKGCALSRGDLYYDPALDYSKYQAFSIE